MVFEAHTISSPPSSNFLEIIERDIKRLHPHQSKKMINHGISRSEMFEDFLEDKKQIESDLCRKPEWLSQHGRNWLKTYNLSFSTEPWGESKYREQGAGHNATIR